MPEKKSLHDMFIDELRDAYDAEKQLTKALPKLAKAARSEELKTAFEEHLMETEGQVKRLEQVFASLNEKPRGKHCDGIAGIIEEGKSVLEEDIDDSALDACLIAAGQRNNALRRCQPGLGRRQVRDEDHKAHDIEQDQNGKDFPRDAHGASVAPKVVNFCQ